MFKANPEKFRKLVEENEGKHQCACGCGRPIIIKPIHVRDGIPRLLHGCAGRRPISDRFWAKVQKGEGDACWLWMGARCNKGYGRISKGRRQMNTHRFSYELAFGPIPEGKLVCHRCDNPPCVNPAHLFLGSASDNMIDMRAKGRWSPGKLTNRAVKSIRQKRKAGEAIAALASEYNVSISTIEGVVSGRAWNRGEPPIRLAKRRGERSKNAKLTENAVKEIRQRMASGETMAALAAEYQVSTTTIYHVAKGKVWAHVPGALQKLPRGHAPRRAQPQACVK